MKRAIAVALGVTCVSLVPMTGALGAMSDGLRAGGPTKVACANKSLKQVSFKRTPARCAFVKRGTRAALYTKSLKWKHWGHPHARAKGTAFDPKADVSTPVKVQLSKPVNGCDGGRVYSSIKVRLPEVDVTQHTRLDTCRR